MCQIPTRGSDTRPKWRFHIRTTVWAFGTCRPKNKKKREFNTLTKKNNKMRDYIQNSELYICTVAAETQSSTRRSGDTFQNVQSPHSKTGDTDGPSKRTVKADKRKPGGRRDAPGRVEATGADLGVGPLLPAVPSSLVKPFLQPMWGADIILACAVLCSNYAQLTEHVEYVFLLCSGPGHSAKQCVNRVGTGVQLLFSPSPL